MILTIVLTVEDEQIDNLLSAAFEGGITYWCDSAVPMNNDFRGQTYASEVLTKGGSLILTTDDQETHTLTLDMLCEGIEKAVVQCGFTFEDYDSGDADCVIQLALFGELVYS